LVGLLASLGWVVCLAGMFFKAAKQDPSCGVSALCPLLVNVNRCRQLSTREILVESLDDLAMLASECNRHLHVPHEDAMISLSKE